MFNKNITGTFDDVLPLTGSITYANREDELLEGQLATPTELLLVLNVEDISVSTITTSYTDAFGNFIMSETQTGEVCNATSPESLPQNVQSNDFGSLSPVVCENGDIQLSTWKALSVFNSGNESADSVDIQVNTTIKDSLGTDLSLSELTYSFTSGQVVNIAASFIDITTGVAYNFQTID